MHRRQDAAYVLGHDKATRRPSPSPAAGALHNPDSLLRMIIVEALGKIGDPAGVDTLRKAVGDMDSSVSGAARKALKQMGAPPGAK